MTPNAPSPLIEQILSGHAPRKVKEFAAQGLLPIGQDELIPLQVFLTSDADAELARQAKASLAKIPEDTWMRLTNKREVNVGVVRFCLSLNPSFQVKETILLNTAIPDEIFREVAARESGKVLDLVLNNHQRLLRDPELFRITDQNRMMSPDQKRRWQEFKEEFVYKKQKQAAASAAPEAAQPVGGEAGVENIALGDLLALIPGLDAESRRIIEEADKKEEERPTDEQAKQELNRIMPAEELSDTPPEILSVYQRVMQMKQGEKIRVALLGNKEERQLLIRDSSRQVASMVLKSPKLTDTEVENFAQLRNLDGDVLRQIGQHREFLKKYTIPLFLVKNPKTPSPIALNLLKLLRESDLKNLERDRNIPEVIRRQAKKTRELKAQEKH